MPTVHRFSERFKKKAQLFTPEILYTVFVLIYQGDSKIL